VAALATEPTFEITDGIREVGRRAATRSLCAECYGRLFGRWGHGLSNTERAARVRAALEPGSSVDGLPCSICRGTFDRLELWADRSLEASKDHEWHRFSCGSRWDPEILATEEALWTDVGATWGESARGAFNRELGKRIEARTGASGGPDRPDVVMLADLMMGRVEITVLPFYARGRYRKLDRTLPQTRWPCRRCDGRGCDACSGTGKTYAESVEELVGAPLLRATAGKDTRFHGMGREDIDARMLGRGRPFVIEIRAPGKRTVDLAEVTAAINRESGGRVEVDALVPSDGADVVRVKEANPQKSYRVAITGEAPEAKIKEVLSLVAGREIAQRTPTRVAHRRADRVRARRIVAAQLVSTEAGGFTLDLRAEAGTYIKEWVEGDGGRTEPSLSGLLATPLHVAALDVLEIHDQEP
jgi:tRNA pseudouridine synthase 10